MAPSSEIEVSTKTHFFDGIVFPGGLVKTELFWRDRQPWLAESGYMLRPRYRHDWEPSWLKSKTNPYFCEDGRSPPVSRIAFDQDYCNLTVSAADYYLGRCTHLRRARCCFEAGPQVQISK